MSDNDTVFDDPTCDRCDKRQSQHAGIELLCPFYSTFRPRALPGAAASGREDEADALLGRIVEHFRSNRVPDSAVLEISVSGQRYGPLYGLTLARLAAARSAPRPGGQAASDAQLSRLMRCAQELDPEAAHVLHDHLGDLHGNAWAKFTAGERRCVCKGLGATRGCPLHWPAAERGAASGDTGASHG